MRLSVKQLEDLLWEQPALCEAHGLCIHQAFFARGCRYRRLHLGPYGVAPLVNMRFWPATNTYYLQVVVLTVGPITTALYQRAKRYASGLRDVVIHTVEKEGIQVEIAVGTVLIGRDLPSRVDNLVYTLNLDNQCEMVTFYGGLGEIRFHHWKRRWGLLGPNGPQATLATLTDDIRAERTDAQRLHPLAPVACSAHYSDLVVTATGIIASNESGTPSHS